MDTTIALKIITNEIELFRSQTIYDELIIDFMGGEPLLNFQVIKECSEFIWNTYPNVNCKLFLRTNGTLLSDRMKEWFVSNRHRISVGLSLDGGPSIQNSNRTNSYSNIPINFFLKNWPQQKIKATISPIGLDKLAENIIQFHDKGYPFDVTIALGVEWSDKHAEIFENQMIILMNYYLNHPEIEPVKNLFEHDFRNIIKSNDDQFTMCGTNGEIIAYTSHGDAVICHMFGDITMGENYAEINLKAPKYLKTDTECCNCIAKSICKICPANNYLTNKNFHIQDKRICKMLRIIVKINAMFYCRKFNNAVIKGHEISPRDWKLLEIALNLF